MLLPYYAITMRTTLYIEKKIIPLLMAAVVAMFFTFFLGGTSSAQEQNISPKTLVIGTISLPPYAMKTSGGVWNGVAIDLLHSVAQELNATTRIIEFDTRADLEEALIKGEVDLTPCFGITEAFEKKFDFSIPYLQSGTVVAMRVGSSYTWDRVTEIFFSIYSHKTGVIFFLSWLVAGFLVWFFERKRNAEVFGKRLVEGVGNGIWWASVTMTTVGYGDKAPKTIGGRIVAVIWMFCAIIMITGFTATMASSLAVSEIKNTIHSYHDLQNYRVGVLNNSSLTKHLHNYGITPTPFQSIQEGLKEVTEKKIDVFVSEENILKYTIKQDFSDSLQVQSKTIDHFFLGMAMAPKSQLLEPFNRALLKVVATEEWKRKLNRF